MNAAVSPGFESGRLRFAITTVGVVKAMSTVRKRTAATPPAGAVIDKEVPVVLLCALPMCCARMRATAMSESRRATSPSASSVVTRARQTCTCFTVLAAKRIAAAVTRSGGSRVPPAPKACQDGKSVGDVLTWDSTSQFS